MGDSGASRGKWSSKFDYIVTVLGTTVSYGNVWRFPFLCYHYGGGAFLIPYFIMLFLMGIPIFFLETSMGQFSSSTILNMYEIAPALRGSGICSLLVVLISTIYYCVLVAYPLVYLWHTLKNYFWDQNPLLPWASCDNYWNTDQCYPVGSNPWQLDNNGTTNLTSKPSAQEFFKQRVLQVSSGLFDIGGLVTEVHIANVIVWVLVFLTIFKGVKVIGKASWITSLLPLAMLLLLLVRCLTLPGALRGAYMFLVPRWENLLNPQVWISAAVQVFFTLGIGWGTLHYLGSYNKFNNNSLTDAFIVPLLNAFTSFIAGLLAFAVLGFMNEILSTPIDNIAGGGPELAFVVYTEAVAMMPGATFWAVCFFIMFFFLGVTDCFILVETAIMSIIDYYPRFRSKKTLLTLFVCFLLYLGSLIVCTNSGIHWLRFLDEHAVPYGIVYAALTEILAFAFLYGPGFIKRDVETMLGFNISMYWIFTWLISCPLILFSIYSYWNRVILADNIFRSGDVIESVLGIFLSLLPIWIAPLYWWYCVLTTKARSIPRKFINAHCVTSSWGPGDEVDRQNWMEAKDNYPSTLLYKYLGIGRKRQQGLKMNSF